MQIDYPKTLAGLPIRRVRDFLRSVDGDLFSARTVAERLGKNITADLLAAGWIERCTVPGVGTEEFYRTTLAGHQLSLVRLIPRIPRAKAEEIVRDLLRRAEAVNANPDYLVRVVELYAFGSYITSAPDLGDVDIAVRFEDTNPPGTDIVALNFARAQASGRRSLSFLDRLSYGEMEVRKVLKNRNRYLSLHWFSELERLGCERRRIFPPPRA